MPRRARGYVYVRKNGGTKRRQYVRGAGRYNVLRRPANAGFAQGRALQGRGGYYDSGPVKWLNRVVPKGLFSSMGRAGGSVLGSAYGLPKSGGGIGEWLGDKFSKLIGFGDYKVAKNTIISEGSDPPAMHSTMDSIRVRHREYICDIYSSATANAFSIQVFDINPALPLSFPWLSAIAQQYQEWAPKGIMYEFKSLSAVAIASSVNTTMGGVIIATDYNSVNASFVNKQQMDNTQYTTSAVIGNSFCHPIECDMKQNPLNILYTRPGALPASTDQRMYDLGTMQIASFGVQGTTVLLGELWVTFDIELRKPISTAALADDILTDHFQLATCTGAAPLGTGAPVSQGTNTIGCVLSNNTTVSFPATLQEGSYLVMCHWISANTATIVVPVVGTYVNCAAKTLFYSTTTADALAYANAGAVANSSTASTAVVISLTGSNASFAFGVAGTLPTTTFADLVITQWNSNVVA